MVYSARENLLLLLPGPGERVWQSDFPASAALVRQSIERTLAKKAPAADEYGLQWPSYCADRCDVAFALNGGWLKVVTAGGTGRCTARAGTHVRYGRQFRASTLFGARGYYLRIDQAPYWALQELGWLHPYSAVYEWDCRKQA